LNKGLLFAANASDLNNQTGRTQKKAAYVTPVILTMAANLSFASAGSTDYKHKEKKIWKQKTKRRPTMSA
jgi:hypothetical protein